MTNVLRPLPAAIFVVGAGLLMVVVGVATEAATPTWLAGLAWTAGGWWLAHRGVGTHPTPVRDTAVGTLAGLVVTSLAVIAALAVDDLGSGDGTVSSAGFVFALLLGREVMSQTAYATRRRARP